MNPKLLRAMKTPLPHNAIIGSMRAYPSYHQTDFAKNALSTGENEPAHTERMTLMRCDVKPVSRTRDMRTPNPAHISCTQREMRRGEERAKGAHSVARSSTTRRVSQGPEDLREGCIVTKKIDIPHESDESKEVRPTFFNEPPVMYTGGDLPWQWEEDGMVCTRAPPRGQLPAATTGAAS